MLSRLFMNAAITALVVGLPVAGHAATDIGGVTAANPTMQGRVDGAASRALAIGNRVIENELIVTSPEGSGQILFLDQTTLGIAPSSRIVLDSYVYDPDRSAGKIGLSLTRGALRFIGGRITKLREAVIGTPAATIGIRGGAAYFDVEDDGATTVIHLGGERTVVIAAGVRVSLTRPSTKAIIRPGEAPEVVGQVTVGEIDTRFRQFEGGGGGLQTTLSNATAVPFVNQYGSGEPGVVDRPVIATNGGTYDSDDLRERERFGIGLTVSPVNDFQDNNAGGGAGGGNGGGDGGGNGGGDGGNGGGDGETVVDGVFGAVVIAAASSFSGANGAVVNDPEAQTVILGPGQPIELTEVRAPERIGIAANGDRYVIPISETGGVETFTDGTYPPGTLAGTSEIDPNTGFITSNFITDSGQSGLAFFGTGTPGQLGASTSEDVSTTDTFEVREYTVDAFTGNTFDNSFTNPLTAELNLIEQPGEGFRDESGALGFAKVSHVVLNFENSTSAAGDDVQSSFLSVGTGRISNSTRNAPLPDLGIYGSVQVAGDTTPTTFEGNGTVIESGDGSTVFGPDGEHIVFGSGSRFAFADGIDDMGNPIVDDDIEATPIRYDTFDGTTIAANGFLGRGDLAGTRDINQNARLGLGVDYATAVSDEGFNSQNDDTAFTGGYAAGIGISSRDGLESRPYILRSDGSDGARFAFDASQNEANGSLRMVTGASTSINESAENGVSANGPNASDISTVSYNFGSASTRSAMTTDREFALRNRTSETADFFVDNDTNINGSTGREPNGVQQAFRGALISNPAAGAASNAIYAGVLPDDDHDYLRWGWWSGEFRFSDTDTFDFAGRRERTHLGTWISGNRLDQSIVAARMGSAEFSGHAVVSVADSSGQFVSGGSFDMLYDFDEGSGNAEFRDIAGYDFDVAVSGNEPGGSSDPHYSGSNFGVTGTGGRPDIDVGIAGSFFGDSAADSIKATAGQIDIQSTDGISLRGSGVFGGDIVPQNPA